MVQNVLLRVCGLELSDIVTLGIATIFSLMLN
jgi:hypothetical protein